MAIGKFLAPLNGNMYRQQVEKPYVDDIFDPLFNADVTNYYRNLYGGIGAIPAGYAAMLENALSGKKGILGPGMGILSTFGRSMDKADDFILGGLTEGVNLIGRGMGGLNEAPQNPIKRIFVDDYNYEGTKLMAAAGNAMAKLAGTQTPLTEADFNTMGDKIAGTTIDLATDPGIMGGQLARLNPNTSVGQVGRIMSSYDDAMANIAGNMAFPGGKALIGKGLTRIRDFLGGASSTSPVDMVTKHANTTVVNPYTGIESYTILAPETLDNLKNMSSDITINIDPISDPDLYALKEEIDNYTNYIRPEDYLKYQDDLNKINIEQADKLAKKNEAVQRIKDTATKERDTILKSSMEGMKKHPEDFLKNTKLPGGIEYEEFSKTLNTPKKLLNYVKNNFADYNEYDYFGNRLEYGKFYDSVKYNLQNNGLESAQKMVLDKISPTITVLPESTFTFAPNKMGFQSTIAKDSLDIINYHFKNFLQKHPKGLYNSYLKNELGLPEGEYIPKNIFDTLVKYNKGNLVDAESKVITGKSFQELLDSLYSRNLDLSEGITDYIKESHNKISLIPWVRQHADSLQKTQVGRDLIDLADNLEKDIFDNNLYETAIKNNNVKVVSDFDEGIGGVNDTYFGEAPIEESSNFNTDIPTNTEYSEVISPAKLLNQYLSKTKFTPEDLQKYAEDFPYLDLKVSQNYIKNSPQYAEYIAKQTKIDNLITKEASLREAIKGLRQELSTTSMYENDLYFEHAQLLDKLTKEYKALNPNLSPEDWLKQQMSLRNSIKLAPTDLEEMVNKYYIPAKKAYWQKVRGTPYAYDFTNITPENIYDAAKKVAVTPNVEDYTKISSGLATFNPTDFTKTITSNFSLQDNITLDLYEKTFDDFKMNWNLPGDFSPIELEPYIKDFGTREEKTLFKLWIAAVQSKVKNKLQTFRGVFNVPIVQKSKQHVDDLIKSNKYTPEQIAEYISRKDIAEGVKLSGDNFLESLWASSGFKEFPIPAKYTKEQGDAIAKAIQENVNKINKYGNIVKFVDVTGEDKVRRLAIFFDTDNLNIKKDINKIYSLFGKKDLGLSDVVLRSPVQSSTKFDSKELDSLFGEIRQGSQELSTKLGYTKFSDNYISHAMDDTDEAAKLFNGIYKDLGIDKDKLEQLTQALKEQDIASGRLQFGAIPMERSHLGYFGQYAKGFSTDLAKIHSSTFTNGMLSDTNAQTFFDLFLSDNFKIKNNFDNVDTLKQALNLSEGNLNNLSIVKPRYNEAGKLIGFTKYDKFSDVSLAKAFSDEEAILVPDSVIGSLDRICKKDARMSNRVYRFINKYLTVPFKFGTLANPGFLAGNIQDAYFKQAVELSKKYGTTIEDELTNVAMSMRHVTVLNNKFSEVFDGYRQWLKDTDLNNFTMSNKPASWAHDTFKYSKASIDTLTIDQIVNKPELYNAFKQYIEFQIPVEQRKMAKLYLFLNNNQTTTMFKNNVLDLEDVKDLTTDNPYAVPNNLIERIMYGDPSKNKGFSSYGLFLNNPVSNGILKSSTTIENWMRSATIINDLQHKGYTMDDICDILELDKVSEKALRNKFKMDMNEAINTMHAANFDYDNVSSFMDKASYILPFPTFYLKNLAFWADIFTNKPQLIDNVISTHEGLWSGKDTKDEFVAEAKGRGAVPIGQQNKHLTGIVKQTPYNSMFGAFNAINNAKEDFAYRTNPILRPIARHLQDPEDVKYRPYNTNQYQKNIKKGDSEFSELAYMFHQLNPYERFMNTGLRTPGKVSRNDYQLSDFLPSLFQPDFSKKSR